MGNKARWLVVAVCSLLIGLGLAPGDSEAAATRTISLQTPSAATTGAAITLRGAVTRTPKGSLVVIRRLSGTRWVKVATTRTTTRAGDYVSRVRAPGTGGTYRYRADAPRTASSPTVVSRSRSVVVRVQIRASIAASNLTPVEGSAITLSGLVSPWLAGTPVVLQQRLGSASTWSVVRTIGPDTTGRFRVGVVPRAGTVSRFRISVSARGYRTSAASTVVTVTPVASGPAVVSNLKVSSASKQVKLTWQNPVGATGVVVRRAVGSVPPSTPASGTAVPTTGVATSATDSTVDEDQAYSYSVFARTGSGTSPPVSAARTGPPTASNGWHTTVPGRIAFHWTNPAGVDRVVVDVHYDSGVWLGFTGLPPTAREIGDVDTYTVSGLPSLQWVYLWIYTLDAAGNFQGAYVVSARSPVGTDTPSGPVTGPTATATPRAVTLAWTSPESAPFSDVTIARAEGTTAPAGPTSGWIVGRTRSTETTTDDMVQPGTTYTYGLWAVDSSGNYSTRASVTVTTPEGSPPGPVTGLSATALSPTPDRLTTGYDPQRVRLQWASPPGAEAVVVARAEGPTAPGSPVDSGGWNLPLPADTLMDRGLEADTEYSYAVWAVAPDGSYSSVATTTVRTDANLPRSVSGRVLDASGSPVGSVPLTFNSQTDVHPTGFASYTTTAAPDGSYHIDLPIGPYTACANGTAAPRNDAHGYTGSCSSLTVTAAASTSLDLTIGKDVTIRGVVTDGTTGRPVAGVTVLASRPYPYLWPVTTTTTDEDGRYVVEGVSPVDSPLTWVRVDGTTATNGPPQGYQPGPLSKVVTATAGETVTQDIILAPRRVVTITGRVTGTLGSPVAGVGVHLVDANGVGDGMALAYTGADGRYTVTTALSADETRGVCFDAERHQAAGAGTGYANQCFGGADFDPEPPDDPHDRSAFGTTTPVSATTAVDIALARATTVSGSVTAAGGAKLHGAVVTVLKHNDEVRRTATTDASGRFAVAIGAPAGGGSLPVRVCVSTRTATGGTSSGGYASPSCVDRSISAAAPTTGVDFVAQPAATVEGTVRDSVTDAPATGLTVELRQQGAGVGVRETTTAADGSYSLTELRPEAGVTYLVCASGAGHATTCATLAELGVPGLSAGSTAHAARLAVLREGSVSGVLTGADTGEPLADVDVTLHGNSAGSTTTDAEGRYAFDRLTPGEYRLEATANTAGPRGYHRTTSGDAITVAPGENTSADLAMRPASAVRVRAVTPDGRPAPGVALEVRGDPMGVWVYTDAQGYGTVKGLDPTTYPQFEHVCAGRGYDGPGTRAGYTPGCGWLPVLADGRTSTTTVVVGLGGFFGAWVRDATTGKPIPGATVTLAPASGAEPYAQTSELGFVFPGREAIHSSLDGANLLNPARPRIESARICVTAHGYESACFGSNTGAAESAPFVQGHPGLQTIASFELSPVPSG